MKRLVAAATVAAIATFALAVAGTSASAASDGSTIVGGHTQSVDPTRYDYVPPASGTVGIQPMSATGFGQIPAFRMSVGNGGATIDVPVAAGYLYHQVTGSGLTITNETAAYVPSPGIGFVWNIQICNWRIDFQNRQGSTILTTSTGATYYNCTPLGIGIGRTNGSTRTLGVGDECARLYVGYVYRGEQCHHITK